MKRSLTAAILAGVLAVSLAGCGNSGASNGANDAASESSTTTSTSVDANNTVRVAAVDPGVALDTQQYTFSIIMKISDNICESLLKTNDDGSMEPTLLTEMPEISEDGLTYSFELLPDVKFHNGEILKSSDVKYSYVYS